MEHLIREIYNDTKHIDEGKVADYIPQLAEVNPEMYGVSFCDLNGNITTVGDSENAFCLQSCVKPLNYCLARNQENTVENAPITHQHVGFEPSGVAFNAFVMNRAKLPHNPLINSGAIMTAALIAADREPSARFDMLQKFICRLSGFGGHAIGFDNSVYLSEKVHADRNISLAYYMRENKAFPGEPTQSELNDHLELYFQSCSLTASARTVSAIAATLANHGKSPVSGETVLEPEIVMDALSIMFMCGMYDFSGQFAFNIGLPAKSGVAGALLIVIPNVGGICTWSPRLDELGNSVRGIAFCAELAKRTQYAYHIFRTLRNNADTQAVSDDEHDVRNIRSIETFTHRIIHACSANDMDTLRKLVEYGSEKFRKPDESINDVSKRLTDLGDYDRRTCVHLAAAEGHEDVLKFLLMHGANPHPKDRWGNTPLHEVRKAYKHQVKLHSAKGYTPTADELSLRDRYKAIFFTLAEGDPLHDGNQSGLRSRSDSNADLHAEWDSISRSNSKEHLPDMLLGALESKSSGQVATHTTIPLTLTSIPESKSPMKGASDASSEPVSTVTPAPGMDIDAIKKNLGGASANQPAKAIK